MSLVEFGVYYTEYFDSYGVTAEVTTPLVEATTAAQILALIEAPDLIVEPGLDLLDVDDRFVADISEDLVALSSEHGNYRTLHGTIKFDLSRRLDWGIDRVRPWVKLTSLTLNLYRRWNEGIYLPTTPERTVGEEPETYGGVEGYDKLVVLDVPAGRTVTVASGDNVLDTVAALIVEAGEPATSIRLDASAADKVFAQPRLWPLTDSKRRLTIVNEMLDYVGYRGLYMDREGRFTSEPYVAPANRAPEWVYDADDADTIVGELRTEHPDFFEAPNRWIGVRNDPTSAGLPVVDDGIHVEDNETDGLTSQVARGRIIPADTLQLDAVDQDALVSQVRAYADRGKRVDKKLHLTTGINPTHWHFTVVEYRDEALPPSPRKFIEESWSVDLFGGEMAHELREA